MAQKFSKAFYNSKEWENVREYCLMRDKYLCVNCGAPAEEVHHKIHLTPQNIGDKSISLNPNNLASLCRACHFEQHRGEHANGLKAKQREEKSQYTFDENGYLVRKNI
ncbi:MAG: HNH endonuclease [Bacteroidales bacterium]|nr:HNH endonuclease [Candidatus Scybalousia scybalohippi]